MLLTRNVPGLQLRGQLRKGERFQLPNLRGSKLPMAFVESYAFAKESRLMITMRRKQVEILSRAALKSFEDRMLTHVKEFFAEKCEKLGNEKTHETIRQGMLKARKYGILSEYDVCIFIDVMFEYGVDFDVDPELPWANQVLNDPAIWDPAYRVNRLFDAATGHEKRATIDYEEEEAKAA